MYKLKIIIADHDGKYLNKVLDFMSSKYLSRFMVSAFSRPAVFEDYLCCSGEKINILLAHPDFLNFSADLYQNFELILVLFDGSIECCSDTLQLVNKYLPGEKLVSELLNRYSEMNLHVSKLITGAKQTKVIPIYSAAGGSGKSTITLGLAAKLGRMGKSTLLLSLESLNSILPGTSGVNDAFMHILFTAVDNPGALPVKVETRKSADAVNGFDFIEPPGCFYEISNLQGKEAGLLLDGLVQMSKYDFILVDLEAKPDEITLEVVKRADKLVLVVVGDTYCDWKTDRFLRQVDKLEIFSGNGFTDKILPVLNKYDGGTKGCLEKYGLNCPLTVPVVSNLWQSIDGEYRFDPGQKLSNSLIGVANAITESSDYVRS